MRASLKAALGISTVLIVATFTLVLLLGMSWNSEGVKVVAPSEKGLAAWGDYLTTAYSRDTLGQLVLVGNVRDNPTLRSYWNLTGLSPSESLNPHFIRKGNVTFVTGTENNIYLTAKYIKPEFHTACLLAFIAVFLAVVIISAASLGDSMASAFYLLIALAIGIWALDASPHFTDSALKIFYKVLVGSYDSHFLSNFRPLISLENLFYVHTIFMLVMVTALFYTAPKRFRELGFVIVGTLLALPLFRSSLANVDPLNAGILSFTVSIAIIATVVFSEIPWKSALQTILLAFFTVVSIILQPWTAVIPVAFVMTFPRRRRNVIYIVSTVVGLLVALWYVWGNLPEPTAPNASPVAMSLQLIVPASVMLCAAIKRRPHLRSKGMTAFMMITTAVMGIASVFGSVATPYLLASLTILAVRLIPVR